MGPRSAPRGWGALPHGWGARLGAFGVARCPRYLRLRFWVRRPSHPRLSSSRLSCRCLAVLLHGLELTRQCLLGLGGRPHSELPIMADGKGNGHMGSLHGLPLLCVRVVRRRDNPGGRLLTPQRASALHEHPTGGLLPSPAHVAGTPHGSCNIRVYPIQS